MKPFFIFLGDLGDNNGVGWAPFAAYPAENAFLDINFYAPPGNPGKNSFSFRVHEGCWSLDQVLGHGFCHGERSHVLTPLPFCTADTWVQR